MCLPISVPPVQPVCPFPSLPSPPRAILALLALSPTWRQLIMGDLCQLGLVPPEGWGLKLEELADFWVPQGHSLPLLPRTL
jgi:hypothetical protein